MAEAVGTPESARREEHQRSPVPTDSVAMEEKERAGEVSQGEDGRVELRQVNELQISSAGSRTELARAAAREREGGDGEQSKRGDSGGSGSYSNADRCTYAKQTFFSAQCTFSVSIYRITCYYNILVEVQHG